MLRDQHGRDVSLGDFAGRCPLLLVFFPFAFSGICTSELGALRDDPATFVSDTGEDAAEGPQAGAVQVVALSCDPLHSLRAWAEAEGYRFSLLSDFWPHGEVARRYGVFLPDKGFATRGTFLVDTGGIVRWRTVHEPGQARDPGEYRAALASLTGR